MCVHVYIFVHVHVCEHVFMCGSMCVYACVYMCVHEGQNCQLLSMLSEKFISDVVQLAIPGIQGTY